MLKIESTVNKTLSIELHIQKPRGLDWTDWTYTHRLTHIRNPLTLLSHCTLNKSMLRNIFTDSQMEDKGE